MPVSRRASKRDRNIHDGSEKVQTEPSYRGPNPPRDPMGQSYNDFYKENERLSRRQKEDNALDTEVMAAAFKWINDNIGMFSFESKEEEENFIRDHLKCSRNLLRYCPAG